MGAWILAAFGTCVVPGLIALELHTSHLFAGATDQILRTAAGILIFGSAIFGVLLATYTGVLIGATAIPAWFLHRLLLPIHFGTAGLGSAAALLELLGHRIAPECDRIVRSWRRISTPRLAVARQTGAADRAILSIVPVG
jgi:formate-dependent nitrite reductase membrane component NrfD